MKFRGSHITLALLVALTSMPALAEVERKKTEEAKIRPTHEALMLRRAEAAEKANAERNKRGLKTVEPGSIEYTPPKKRPDIMARSAILSSGTNWTIVPKEALLHLPDHYRSRVNGQRNGKLVPWPQFYAKNRGWIHTHTVSIGQARGEVEISSELSDAYKRLSRVVIAVCHKGPISVKPLKVDEKVAGGPGVK